MESVDGGSRSGLVIVDVRNPLSLAIHRRSRSGSKRGVSAAGSDGDRLRQQAMEVESGEVPHRPALPHEYGPARRA